MGNPTVPAASAADIVVGITHELDGFHILNYNSNSTTVSRRVNKGDYNRPDIICHGGTTPCPKGHAPGPKAVAGAVKQAFVDPSAKTVQAAVVTSVVAPVAWTHSLLETIHRTTALPSTITVTD